LQSARLRCVGLDFVSARIFRFTILQGSQAVAVHSGIGVRRIFIEALPNHQDRFSMRVATIGGRNLNCRGERDVAGHFFPYKMKGIVGEPHVGAAAGNGVRAISVRGAACLRGRANVSRRFEDTQVGSFDRAGTQRRQQKNRSEHDLSVPEIGCFSHPKFWPMAI
jgi:hypothetical protein